MFGLFLFLAFLSRLTIQAGIRLWEKLKATFGNRFAAVHAIAIVSIRKSTNGFVGLSKTLRQAALVCHCHYDRPSADAYHNFLGCQRSLGPWGLPPPSLVFGLWHYGWVGHTAFGRLSMFVQKTILWFKTRLLRKQKAPAAVGRLKKNAVFVQKRSYGLNNAYGEKKKRLRQ